MVHTCIAKIEYGWSRALQGKAKITVEINIIFRVTIAQVTLESGA